MIQEAIKRVVGGEYLTTEEATAAVEEMIAGHATPAQIGALLIALRMRGETVEEATGFVRALRNHVVRVHPKRTPLLDTCGTGGSTVKCFNVSTTSSFVVAATGIAIAKHGNRAMSGVCGSADVLEALGVRVTLTPEQCADCIDTVGVGFLFAQQHHPALRLVGPIRREIGVRTLFNLVGPLTNPAGATHQVMGVYAKAQCAIAAGVLRNLGSERAVVVHGEIGIGEISTIGATDFAELRDGEIVEGRLTPNDFGLTGTEPELEAILCETTTEANATLVRNVLTPAIEDARTLAQRNLVAVNVSAALRVCGLAQTWQEGFEQAHRLIQSGKPLEILEHLIQYTQSYAVTMP